MIPLSPWILFRDLPTSHVCFSSGKSGHLMGIWWGSYIHNGICSGIVDGIENGSSNGLDKPLWSSFKIPRFRGVPLKKMELYSWENIFHSGGFSDGIEDSDWKSPIFLPMYWYVMGCVVGINGLRMDWDSRDLTALDMLREYQCCCQLGIWHMPESMDSLGKSRFPVPFWFPIQFWWGSKPSMIFIGTKPTRIHGRLTNEYRKWGCLGIL